MATKKMALHWQILIALALAVASGLMLDQTFSVFGVSFISVLTFLRHYF